MIQTLIAFTIVIILVMTITPSIVIIKKEQNVLNQRLKNSYYLHDILIEELNKNTSKSKNDNYTNLNYTIRYQDELIKVCGTWINIKEKQENRCYYGKRKQV